jgi:hypothetical protein
MVEEDKWSGAGVRLKCADVCASAMRMAGE